MQRHTGGLSASAPGKRLLQAPDTPFCTFQEMQDTLQGPAHSDAVPSPPAPDAGGVPDLRHLPFFPQYPILNHSTETAHPEVYTIMYIPVSNAACHSASNRYGPRHGYLQMSITLFRDKCLHFHQIVCESYAQFQNNYGHCVRNTAPYAAHSSLPNVIHLHLPNVRNRHG